MWGTYPRAEMENAHIIQEPKIPLIEKPLSQPKKKIRGYEYQDQLTRSLKKNLYRGPWLQCICASNESQLDRSLVSVWEEAAHSLGYGHKGYFFAKSCNVIFARGSQ